MTKEDLKQKIIELLESYYDEAPVDEVIRIIKKME